MPQNIIAETVIVMTPRRREANPQIADAKARGATT
jgi:hypothetical protein